MLGLFDRPPQFYSHWLAARCYGLSRQFNKNNESQHHTIATNIKTVVLSFAATSPPPGSRLYYYGLYFSFSLLIQDNDVDVPSRLVN